MRDEAHTDKSERPLMGTGTGVGSFSRGNVISHLVCWCDFSTSELNVNERWSPSVTALDRLTLSCRHSFVKRQAARHCQH